MINPGGATGVNLRAMDAGAALVLVNGVRLSAAGPAEYTDISSIPLRQSKELISRRTVPLRYTEPTLLAVL